jgi:hypothetical protein
MKNKILAVLAAILLLAAPARADLTVLTYSTGGGVGVAGTNVWTGSNTFTDSLFAVADDGDATKKIAFQASGITTGTTRTMTPPNADATLAGLGVAQTFTGTQTYTGSAVIIGTATRFRLGTSDTDVNAFFSNATQHTPDTPGFWLGSTSNAVQVAEAADALTDMNNGSCGAVACAHPQITLHDNDSATVTGYNSLAFWGNAGRATKTLTESAATSAFSYTVASGAGTGGTVNFTVFATDGTDPQTLTGTLQFTAGNKAGTESCVTPTLVGTALNSSPVGTLTCTYAGADGGTNACFVQFNCVSSLVQTTLEVYYRVNLIGPGQVTPQ